MIEPLTAVPLNDELHQARALVAMAEADVLLMVTEKVAGITSETAFIIQIVIYLSSCFCVATIYTDTNGSR